jgi:hypothetical protein
VEKAAAIPTSSPDPFKKYEAAQRKAGWLLVATLFGFLLGVLTVHAGYSWLGPENHPWNLITAGAGLLICLFAFCWLLPKFCRAMPEKPKGGEEW